MKKQKLSDFLLVNQWYSLSIALVFSFVNTVMADDDIVPLSPMIIEEESSPATTVSSHVINKLQRENLQAAEMPDLNNVLKNQTGVAIIQGSGQMTTPITIRGAGGAGQGMVTLDGVPLFGNFAGMVSLSHYPLDSLEQVTVTRGAGGGDSQGSRTLGGAIHLQTRRMQEKDNFLHLEGGSYDTVRGAVGSGLTTQVGNFSAVVGRSDIFNGISQAQKGTEGDNFGLTHASGNWFKDLGRGRLDASVYFTRSDEDIDGPGFVPSRHAIGWVDDKRGKLSDETWVTQLHGEYDINSYWNSALQFGFTQDRQKMVTSVIKPFSLTNQLFMMDWKNTHRMSLDGNSKNQASLMWGVNTQHQQTLGIISGQSVISPNARGELVIDEWKFNADGRLDNGDVFGNHQVFSLGVNRLFVKNITLFANGGTGYRQPGVSELMNPVFGNKALQGESSAGGEAGLSWKVSQNSELKITGYHQNYRQMIVLSNDTGILKANNVPKADVWGTEMQSKHRWSSIWESGLNYTYMNAMNPITHLHIASRPEHQGVFWNELKLLDPLKLRVEFTAHSGYWFDGANKLRANTAPRLNALLKYQLTSKTELYVRGENITDERTPEVMDFNFNGAAVYAGFRTGF